MRATRTPPTGRLRQLLALAALFAQVFVAVGAPIPAAARSATCHSGPCGCPPAPADQGCCCSAPKPKPKPAPVAKSCCATASAAPKSCCATAAKASPCDEREPVKSCCAGEPPAPEVGREHAPAVRWVVGAFVQRCRGEALGGVLKFDVSAVFESQSQPRPVPDPAAPLHTPAPRASSLPNSPPTPPPRNS